jgi:hypothetical protein
MSSSFAGKARSQGGSNTFTGLNHQNGNHFGKEHTRVETTTLAVVVAEPLPPPSSLTVIVIV